jgi:hypothetical protein
MEPLFALTEAMLDFGLNVDLGAWAGPDLGRLMADRFETGINLARRTGLLTPRFSNVSGLADTAGLAGGSGLCAAGANRTKILPVALAHWKGFVSTPCSKPKATPKFQPNTSTSIERANPKVNF